METSDHTSVTSPEISVIGLHAVRTHTIAQKYTISPCSYVTYFIIALLFLRSVIYRLSMSVHCNLLRKVRIAW